MLYMLGHAQHAEKPASPLAASAGPACKLFAEHAASMLRVLDAKTFRGDVSEKFKCEALPRITKFLRMKLNLFIAPRLFR